MKQSEYQNLNNELIRAAGRVCQLSVLSLAGRMMLMSTYEEFMIVLTFGLLIVGILNLKNK